MNRNDIVNQSKSAIKQWGEQWAKHAKIHSKYKMKSLSVLECTGVGKAVLCVANGYSFEENIETIKKYQHHVDILACDKTLGHLLDNCITPTYVLVCDANVSYSEYLEKWKDKVQDVTLVINVCANPEWTQKGDWKEIFFFVNEDVLHSERKFMELSGCPNMIPAGTNVSNAAIIILNQSNNAGKSNFMGYDKILLNGFDYSWSSKYYSFNHDGDGKFHYMKHIYCRNLEDGYCFSSNNLAFSAQWIQTYIKNFKLPVVQCSKRSILYAGGTGDLAEQMQYSYRQEDMYSVKSLVNELHNLEQRRMSIKQSLKKFGTNHYYNYLATT